MKSPVYTDTGPFLPFVFSPRLQGLGLLLVLFTFGAAPSFAQITITRTSSDVFHFDSCASGGPTCVPLLGAYTSYQIHNGSGTSYDDVWVEIGGFGGGSTIGLATNEDGLYHLGALADGEAKMAFFYLLSNGTTFDPPDPPETHTVSVYDTKPPATPLATQNFNIVEGGDEIEANANKVNTTVATPNPGSLGGLIILTVTGATGTIGGAQRLAYTPAAYVEWPADSYKLVSTSITFTGGNTGTYDDQLFFSLPNPANTDYTATYTFRASGITVAPTSVSPVGYIESGNPIKHTDTGNFGSLAPIQPADNKVTLSKSANPTTLFDGGTVTYTLTFSNIGTDAVVVDEIIDTLPTSPATPTYVVSSSTYDGSGIDDPVTSGNTLTWLGTFSVPAGGSASLAFQVTMPATTGAYTNTAIGMIGAEQIDTTLDTSDNVPATAAMTVYTDADDDGIPDSVEDTNGNSDPSDDDADGDGVPNYLDIDSDNDGITDNNEAGGDPINPTDSDNDSLPDYLDIDADADGIPDNVEAQSTAGYTAPSSTFTDIDGDGLDDAYDANTGSTDPTASAGLTPYDFDGDTTPDHLDGDSDDDGSPDTLEGHDYDHNGTPEATPLDSDTDGDGLDDGYDDVSGHDVNDDANNGASDLPDNGEPGSNVDFRNALVLPVELVAFEALADGADVLLQWATASETINAGFEIQHSKFASAYLEHGGPTQASPTEWLVAAFVDGHGTTETPQSYTYRITNLAPGRHRFRLKQIDFDGSFDYSPNVEVVVEMDTRLVMEPVYPNPFNPEAQFRFAVRQRQTVRVDLFDVLGRRVKMLYEGEPPAGQMQTVRIDGRDLSSGLYLVILTGPSLRQTWTVTLAR